MKLIKPLIAYIETILLSVVITILILNITNVLWFGFQRISSKELLMRLLGITKWLHCLISITSSLEILNWIIVDFMKIMPLIIGFLQNLQLMEKLVSNCLLDLLPFLYLLLESRKRVKVLRKLKHFFVKLVPKITLLMTNPKLKLGVYYWKYSMNIILELELPNQKIRIRILLNKKLEH